MTINKNFMIVITALGLCGFRKLVQKPKASVSSKAFYYMRFAFRFPEPTLVGSRYQNSI